MEVALDVFTSWSTYLFMGLVFGLCLFLRSGTQAVFPSLKRGAAPSRAKQLWEEAVLPNLAMVVGVLLAVGMANYPYPSVLYKLESTVPGMGVRVAYGATFGLLSSAFYRFVTALLKARGVEVKAPAGVEPEGPGSTP